LDDQLAFGLIDLVHLARRVTQSALTTNAHE